MMDDLDNLNVSSTHKVNDSPTLRRKQAPKRVYGKKQTAAPRLFFEHAVISQVEQKNESVESIEDRLANLKISHDDTKVLATTPKSRPSAPAAATPLTERDHNIITTPINTTCPKASITTTIKDESITAPIRRSPRKTQTTTPKLAKDPKPPKRQSIDLPVDAKTATYIQPVLEQAASDGARKLQDFSRWLSKFSDKFDVVKIAEGSYGEVFQMRMKQLGDFKSAAKKARLLARLQAHDGCILKIIPLRSQTGPGSRKFTAVNEIVSEVQLMKLLDPIPGFARFRELHLVRGRFPESLQQSWWEYAEANDDCYNPDPSKKASYPDTQLWAVLEMSNAGRELEKFRCHNVFQAYDIFWGVTLGLARAEQDVGFEHRDLHLGNVCILTPENPPFPNSISEDEFQSRKGYGLSGIQTSIIDYSLSRADLTVIDSEGYPNSFTASCDLDKRKIFDAIGRDDDEKLLRDTYRLMRDTVYRDCDKSSSKWDSYCPDTNLVWLNFLLKNLQKQLTFPPAPCNDNTNTSSPSVHEKELQERLSVIETVLADRKGDDLPLQCAGNLVQWAYEKCWLTEKDFAG